MIKQNLIHFRYPEDSFPIPRIADCIDQIGNAKYVSTFDMLKGYWQLPLTQRAREISAFVTPSGLYQYKVMPVGPVYTYCVCYQT